LAHTPLWLVDPPEPTLLLPSRRQGGRPTLTLGAGRARYYRRELRVLRRGGPWKLVDPTCLTSAEPLTRDYYQVEAVAAPAHLLPPAVRAPPRPRRPPPAAQPPPAPPPPRRRPPPPPPPPAGGGVPPRPPPGAPPPPPFGGGGGGGRAARRGGHLPTGITS